MTDTATHTVSATVNSKAKLTVTGTTVTFADADPTATPSITQTEGAFTVTANARTAAASKATLFVLANADLTSGTDTIGITNVSWTGTGGLAATGTLSKTAPGAKMDDGNWTGSGTRTGTLTYKLANSYSYNTGSYGGVTLTYTLTAP